MTADTIATLWLAFVAVLGAYGLLESLLGKTRDQRRDDDADAHRPFVLRRWRDLVREGEG